MKSKWNVGIFVVIIATIVALPAHAAGWVDQTSGTPSTLRGVDFSSATVGLAVGDLGTIRKTLNGGTSWFTSTSGTSSALYSVFIQPGSSIAYTVGASGTIRTTSTLGTTWSGQTSGTTALLRGVHFQGSSDDGLAVGDGGVIRKTLNGGSSWSAAPSGTTEDLYGVFIVPGTSIAYVVGTNGTIRKSIVLGDSWSAQTSGATATLRAVYFVDSLKGWAVGNTGTIRRTTNGGSSWTSQTLPPGEGPVHLIDVHFFDDLTGWIVGDDGEIYKTVNGGVTWSSVASGTISALLGVDFVDASNGWAVGTSGTIQRYDATAPSAPGALTRTSAANDNTPTFTWTASTDDTAVTAYEYSIDDEAWASVGLVLTVTLAPLEDGSHSIDVRALDGGGNIGPPADLPFSIDTVAPAGTITSGPPGTTSATSATFSFTASEAATFSCSIDSGEGEPCTSPAMFSGFAAGPHTFALFTTDLAGNADATPEMYSWTVTAPAPGAPPALPAGLAQRDNVDLADQPAGFVDDDTTIVFKAVLTDPDGDPVTFDIEVRTVDTPFMNVGTHPSGPFSSGGTAQAGWMFGPGSYHWQARGVDPSGNASAWISFGGNAETAADFTISIAGAPGAPDTTITSNPASSTTSTSAVFGFEATQPSTFTCSIDAGAFVACTGPRIITGLAVGSHTFQVRATDLDEGLTDPSPASFTWTITTEPAEPPTPPGLLPTGFAVGDRVKLADDGNPSTFGDTAVFYLGADGNRYVFTNDKSYRTWYPNFNGVKTISVADLASIPLRGNVTYRPGVKMVKLQTSPTVYVVLRGGILRAVSSEALATELYGSTWNQQIDDINDAFWTNYDVGIPVGGIGDYNVNAETALTPTINIDKGL